MLPIVTIYPSYIPTISQLSLPIPNGLVCQYHPAILGGSIHAAPRKRWGPLVVLCWATSNSWTSLIYIYIYIRLYYYIYNIYIYINNVCVFLPYQKPNRQATEQKPNLAINHFPLNQLESHGFCCWSPEQSPNLHGPASRKRVTAPQTRSASSMAWMGIRWDQFTEKMRISGSKMADFMESILLGGAITCNNHLEKYESQWEG